jgi:MFS family permease
MLPLRCLIFAFTQNPTVLVAAQVFDGLAGACFGIMVPLIVSDVAGNSGHFNLALGAVGFGIGIGGTLSTPASGWMADHFGSRAAFFVLLGIGLFAVLMSWVMPETRPLKESDPALGDGAHAAVQPPAAAAGQAPGEDTRPKPPRARRRA